MQRVKFLLIVALIVFGIQGAYAQGPEPEICQAPLDPETAMEEMDLTQLGGLYLTAEGQIRILVIYVRFRDDNDPHNYWQAGSPPSQMSEIIDPDMTSGSTNFDNLTHYFDVMSLGRYQVVGEAIYVETPHDMAYYGNPPINSSTVEDVLVNAVDSIVDFSQYDNWTRISNYNHENSPDGVVDMIVMVWRRKINPGSAAGWASLGGGIGITLDGVTIERGYPTGSGVTVQWPWDRSEDYNFKLIIHEIGHWLITGTHPYGAQPDHSIWGMLTHPFDGYCVNPFERERLGWIDLVEITGEITANLADYVTTGEAYKYHPPNGATNEFYYFANHQKLHTTSDGKSYDDATVNSADKGIFVMHQQNIYSGQNNILCKVAPGNWNWENPFFTNQCFSQSLPAYRTVSASTPDWTPKAMSPPIWMRSAVTPMTPGGITITWMQPVTIILSTGCTAPTSSIS
jgi:hypothetical protein